MLTEKQQKLLGYIEEYLTEHHSSPSFDEMKNAMNLKSKSGIHRILEALMERGFIRKLPHRARALEVIKGLDSLLPPTQHPAQFSKTIPLYGRIAAGLPIEAIKDESMSIEGVDFIHIPDHIAGRGEHFALEVSGDSMIDAGIHDGDTVIIQRKEQIRDGAIGVALVNKEEVTLKKIAQKQGKIALIPANQNYQTQYFDPEQVEVQGQLVGLIRSY
jgi:repressor LexA